MMRKKEYIGVVTTNDSYDLEKEQLPPMLN